MEAGTTTIIVVCIVLIFLCALVSPLVHRQDRKTIENFAEGSIPNLFDVNQEETFAATSANLPNPKVLESNRQSLIEHMIRNLYFLCTYPQMQTSLQNDVKNLYDSTRENLKMQMGSFDVLCQNTEVKTPDLESKLKDSCNKYYIDLFAQKESSMYPGFDSNYTDLLSASTHPDNSIYQVDTNLYQITKNTYAPRFIKYTYDTKYGMIRANFYTDQGTTVPTYFILALPFAVEFEQLGIFNVVYDIDTQFNIFSYYNTAEDNTQRAMYLTPVITEDSNKNKLNYLEMNYALQNVASIIDGTPRLKQMRVFYSDLLKQGVHSNEFNTLTVSLNPQSAGSYAISYAGNKTSNVTSTVINFSDKTLSLNIDNTKYDETFLKEINAALKKPDTTDFNLFIVMSFNVLTVMLMYKQNIYDHHLVYKRTPLVQSDMQTPYMKVFAFDPLMTSPSSYVNGHNNTFQIMQFAPNMLRLSQTLGYNFKI